MSTQVKNLPDSIATMVSNYWERLKPSLDSKGWGIQQFADAIGVSYQAVVKVRDGGAFGSKNNIKAANVLGLNPAWLATGEGPMRTEANTSPGPDVKGMYPLLSEVQAGRWTELCPIFQPSDATDWRPSTKNLGPCGFMLRVRGRSMENPGGSPSFSEGMILHVNPDIDPMPGNFVVVRRSSTDETTFKRYIQIEGAPYLEAINPDWPKDEKYLKLMPGDAWCGVVVDASLGGLI